MNCQFLLNGERQLVTMPGGSVVLDLLRDELHLTGTREGCREGDCGACTVLLGTPCGSGVSYMAVNSCLLPVAELRGRHLVTIEGLSPDEGLSVVQRAFVDLGASQCGFCTPGMVVSMTGYLLSTLRPDPEGAVEALAGNICRCTGYISVRRAAEEIVRFVGPSPAEDPGSLSHVEFLAEKGVLPLSFPNSTDDLRALEEAGEGLPSADPVSSCTSETLRVAGGTDLFVLRQEQLHDSSLVLLSRDPSLKGVRKTGGKVEIGAAVTVTELMQSGIFSALGDFHTSLLLVSSTQIRNRATVGGNIINASPIGDLTIMLLALGASLKIRSCGPAARHVPLSRFFRGYKDLDLSKDEILESISFPAPDPSTGFSFEKVSLRRHLDIASVNSAAAIGTSEGTIVSADISAGGVAPVPLYLEKTCRELKGRRICSDTAKLAADTAMGEISPIDDVRGSAVYKKLLLGRLVRAHFLKLFPELEREP